MSSATVRMLKSGRTQGWRLALAGLLGALAVGSSVGLLATSAYLISKAALQPPILHLQIAIVGVRAFGIARGVFRYAERVVGHDAAFRTLADLRVDVYNRLVPLAPAGLVRFRRGDLLTRLVTDVDAALDLDLRVLLPFLVATLAGGGSVVLAFAFLPVAGFILLAALLIGGIAVPAVTLMAGGRAERQLAPTRGRLAADVVTTIESSADVIAMQAQSRALDQIAVEDAEATRLARRSAFVVAAGTGLGSLTQGLAVVGSLLVGAAAVSAGQLSGVLLAAVVLLPLAAYESVQTLPTAVLNLARVRGSAGRVFEVIDQSDPTPDPPDAMPLPTPYRGIVQARGLAVTWPGQQEPAVRGVDLDLRAGRRVAVIGPSGAGKSSLALGLLRFLPTTGTLDIDGRSQSRLSGDDQRRVVGLLAQDVHIFDTTVEENVRLARRDATTEDIEAVLRLARLSDWVEGLPEGMQSRVGAHGSSMSGGQRQRLALARILLAQHRVVVLDEPTEHLDPIESALVLRDALASLSDRALLLITHRVAEVAEFDDVIVVENGEVVERGDPAELSSRPGHFSRLLAG